MKPLGALRLHVEPITLVLANEYVGLVHRHHGPVTAGPASFSIAAACENGVIRGVAVAGIPNAANRLTDGFRTIEVVRVATDGTPNACSVLYAAMPYLDYLLTPEWLETRRDAIKAAQHRCRRCRALTHRLQVHHLTYERLGEELPADLEVLCSRCHRAEHGIAA